MLEMKGICKDFGAVRALHDARLKIAEGEIMALAGSNGSGKSTLVKVLAGLVAPNDGEILIDGQKVSIGSGVDSRKLGIATAFQDLSLIPTMSVQDNILLGEEPLFLLLDEVTASLHYDEIETLFGIMRELKREGVSMVYVTHRMDEIFTVCDSITIMRSSETVMDGKVSDFTLNDIVFYMTGHRPEQGEQNVHTEADHGGRELILNVEDLAIDPKVRDVSLKAYKGEIVGIGGLEGQGQPEVIRAILGAVKPDSGKITYRVREVKFSDPADGVKAGIGFISGERNREAMFPVRTISENIFAGNAAKGKLFKFLRSSEVQKFSEDAVEKYNIKIGKLRDPASSLSGGNQQKLVVARWIAMAPDLLLLDDPTKGVDIHSRQDIHDILHGCADEGMTVIISASDTNELLAISDRIYVFYEGRIAAMLSGDKKTPENLVSAMMGMKSAKAEEGSR